MILTWNLDRYTRCYSDSSKQCMDYNSQSSIFQYFAHLDTQRSQAIGNYWSAINSGDSWKIILRLSLFENRQIDFEVVLIEASTFKSVILEKLVFPRDFELQFKISARKESIGFRYNVKTKKNLFQTFFDSEYHCHLCYDSLSRYGLLSGIWSHPFQFIKHDLVKENPSKTTVETYSHSVFTPEYSCGNIQSSEDHTKYSITAKKEQPIPSNLFEDPDVTQLEIDINTATISSSEHNHLKKRQLIDLGDIIDGNPTYENDLRSSQNCTLNE